ncbi:MAG: hypothetical protein AAGK74_16625 [Chloroflexota bacterium]
MSIAIFDFILSGFFLSLILFVSFSFATYWAIGRGNYYQSYALGWLVGILLIILIGSAFGRTPDEVDTTTRSDNINTGQVILAMFFGFVVSGIGAVTSAIWRESSLRQAMQVTGYTALYVLMIFMVLIAGDIVRQMIGIFALTITILMLFVRILITRSNLLQNDDDTAYTATDEQAPEPSRRLHQRVEAIRRNINREENRTP